MILGRYQETVPSIKNKSYFCIRVPLGVPFGSSGRLRASEAVQAELRAWDGEAAAIWSLVQFSARRHNC